MRGTLKALTMALAVAATGASVVTIAATSSGATAATAPSVGTAGAPGGFRLLASTTLPNSVESLSGPFTGVVDLLAEVDQNPAWPGSTTVWEGVTDSSGVHPITGSNADANNGESPADQAKPGFHAVLRVQSGLIGLYTGAPSSITAGGVPAVVRQVTPGMVAFLVPDPGITTLTGQTVTAVDPTLGTVSKVIS